jgi:hypothetical protein
MVTLLAFLEHPQQMLLELRMRNGKIKHNENVVDVVAD